MGTWSIEDPENFKLNSGMQLAGLSAKTVYKIVTVLVRNFNKYFLRDYLECILCTYMGQNCTPFSQRRLDPGMVIFPSLKPGGISKYDHNTNCLT